MSLCDVCEKNVDGVEVSSCDCCESKTMCLVCKVTHDHIVVWHAVLPRIAIRNTTHSLDGSLCRVCGAETRCDNH